MVRRILALTAAAYIGMVAFNADPWNMEPGDNPVDFTMSVVADTNAKLVGDAWLLTGHSFPMDVCGTPWQTIAYAAALGSDPDAECSI